MHIAKNESSSVSDVRLKALGGGAERKAPPTCRHCGKCCHYYKDGRLKKCKFLMTLSNGYTFCRIYPNRLGQKIDEGIYCTKRELAPFDYEGCPYNTDKPISTLLR